MLRLAEKLCQFLYFISLFENDEILIRVLGYVKQKSSTPEVKSSSFWWIFWETSIFLPFQYDDLLVMMSRIEQWGHRLCPKMTFEDFMNRVESLSAKRMVKVSFEFLARKFTIGFLGLSFHPLLLKFVLKYFQIFNHQEKSNAVSCMIYKKD